MSQHQHQDIQITDRQCDRELGHHGGGRAVQIGQVYCHRLPLVIDLILQKMHDHVS